MAKAIYLHARLRAFARVPALTGLRAIARGTIWLLRVIQVNHWTGIGQDLTSNGARITPNQSNDTLSLDFKWLSESSRETRVKPVREIHPWWEAEYHNVVWHFMLFHVTVSVLTKPGDLMLMTLLPTRRSALRQTLTINQHSRLQKNTYFYG